MATTTCPWCGCLIADQEAHTQYHKDIAKALNSLVDAAQAMSAFAKTLVGRA